MILLTILAMLVTSMPSTTGAQTAEEEQSAACPHQEGWKPADLLRILAEHRKWIERQSTEGDFSQGRADLCNAILLGAKLNNANLRWAELNNADLIPLYVWPIRLRQKRSKANRPCQPGRSDTVSGIYRIWPKDRIEISQGRADGGEPDQG